MTHYTTDSGIIYNPSRGAIARARVRRAFRLRYAAIRSAVSALYSRFTPSV